MTHIVGTSVAGITADGLVIRSSEGDRPCMATPALRHGKA